MSAIGRATPHGHGRQGLWTGYFTQMFGQRVGSLGSVLAVEANPFVVKLLSDGLEISGLSSVVKVSPVVLGFKGRNSEKFCERIKQGRPLNGFLIQDDESVCAPDIGQVIEIPSLEPSSYFKKPLNAYALVKVDVDWAEGIVWKSLEKMMRDRHELLPQVTIELDPRRNEFMTMSEILRSMKALYGKGEWLLVRPVE